jgi:hypothetical protein
MGLHLREKSVVIPDDWVERELRDEKHNESERIDRIGIYSVNPLDSLSFPFQRMRTGVEHEQSQ